MGNQKKAPRFSGILKGMFGTGEGNFLEEEALQSPARVTVRSFFSRPTAVFGLVVFVLIFLLVMIGPCYMPIDLGHSDSNLANIAPGCHMMDIPGEMLDEGIADIAAGQTYGVGLSNAGKIYTWGYTRVSNAIDLRDVPEELTTGGVNVRHMAAGNDHAVAIDRDNQFYFWGSNRLNQHMYQSNAELNRALLLGNLEIKQLEAGNQFTALLDTKGNLYLWGNASNADLGCRQSERETEGMDHAPRTFQGNIEKIAVTSNAYVCLLKDGTVAYTGYQKDSPLNANLPAQLQNGSVKVVDIAASSQCAAAVDDTGRVWVWGAGTRGEKDVPEMADHPVKIYGGRYHFTALLQNGGVVSWGDNMYGQAAVPASVQEGQIVNLFCGGYQNYAVTARGEVKTWGLKGFLCGTDEQGRDILSRIVNGGKITMTVGGIAVIIATLIGVILGGAAGYFGGKTDLIISRAAEVIGGMPFLPFALILSAAIPKEVSNTQRMYIIMVVLGALSWVSTFRLVRAQIFSQREQEYVTAAKALGVKESAILRRHILPNVMSVLLVSVTLDFATCMLTESTLSYLGFGITAPTPTWGNMLNTCNDSIVIQQYWWRWVFPAAIFGLCTVCINLIGDGLRDAMDPRSNGR